MADEHPAPADITEHRADLVVVSDGAGHYIVVKPFDRDRRVKQMFYGRGERFYRQWVRTASIGGPQRYQYSFWEPRWNPRIRRPSNPSYFMFKDGEYSVQCDDRRTVLKPVGDEEAARILSASYYERLWKYEAFSLARDEEGNYYYVDRLSPEAGGQDNRAFRVFKGPRGNLRELRMKNVVYDSAGAIFTTHDGELRLVLNTDRSARWVRGRSQTELVSLRPSENRYLIHVELGVYHGVALGTPCDDL